MTIKNEKGSKTTNQGEELRRLDDLLSLASDWYWELDAALRFTHLRGNDIEASGSSDASALLGKCRWETGLQIVGAGGWDAHRTLLAAHERFRDVVVYRETTDGKRHHAAISGAPIFDAHGGFAGYRGIGREISSPSHDLIDAQLFQKILDSSPEPISIADIDSQRLIYTNDAACQALGFSREEMFRLPLKVTSQAGKDTFKQRYRKAAAAGEHGFTTPAQLLHSRDGRRRGWWRVRWQSLEHDGRRLIINTSREVSERKLAEDAAQRTAWTLAALNATSEAMLQAATPKQLYQRACDAAVEAGKLVGAAILVPDPDTDRLGVAVGTGTYQDLLQQPDEAGNAVGTGLAEAALRTGKPHTNENFINDAYSRHWRKHARRAGVRAGAGIPLLRQRRAVAVLLLYSADPRAFGAEIIELLQRMAANICLALDSIEQEAQRIEAEDALRRSEEKYRTILESIADAYYEVDLRGSVTFCNSAFERMLGYPQSQLIGMNYRDFMRPKFANLVDDVFTRIYSSGQSINALDWEVIRQDGDALMVQGSVQLILNSRGFALGFRGIVRDLTERRQEERLLALEHAITRCLAGVSSSRRSLRTVARIICESEQWVDGGYYSLDSDTSSARLVAGWRQPMTEAEALRYPAATEVPAGGLVSSVANTGQPLWVPNMHDDPRTSWHPPTGDKLGRLFFPVRVEGRTIGVFVFRAPNQRPPAQRLLQTFDVIGDQVGQFLQRKRVEQGLRESESRFRSLTELSSDWYWEQDQHFRFIRLEGRHLIGNESLEGDDWLGRRRWETGLVPDSGNWHAHQAMLAAQQPFKDLVLRRTLADGSQRYISISGEPILDSRGQVRGYRGIGRDVTASKHAEQQIHYLATHDSLTTLPNRVLFNQLLSSAIATAKRKNCGFAVMFIDLDRFKLVNDSLGHDAGDHLLQKVAKRLKDTLRTSDTVARLGGDEFVILLQEAQERSAAVIVAQKILKALTAPIIIHGHECRITASIGISMYPQQGHDEQTLMKNADTAMYMAKETGKDNYRFFEGSRQRHSSERLTLEADLGQALEKKQLLLYYQPKLDLQSRRIIGAEALLRWKHPQRGMIPPGEFIPIAEEAGMIVPIGRWVLQTACLQNMAWQARKLPPITVAVNLSPRQFLDENLLIDITNALRLPNMPPQLLEIELTEGTIMHNPQRAAELMKAIKGMGIRIAMDDFGVGYSSLAQLKEFPIDTLKIDRSFIRNLPASTQDQAITKAIVALAKSLQLLVVAEGVETEAQEHYLREIACDQSQGYLFSKPIPANQFSRLLENRLADSTTE